MSNQTFQLPNYSLLIWQHHHVNQYAPCLRLKDYFTNRSKNIFPIFLDYVSSSLSYYSPTDIHQNECRGQGAVRTLADMQRRKEVGLMHRTRSLFHRLQGWLTESLSTMKSSSRVTIRNFTESKEIREYICHFSILPCRPLFFLSPQALSPLYTSDKIHMGILPRKIAWVMTYCLLQLHSQHRMDITGTENIISIKNVFSKTSARAFRDFQAIAVFSYDFTSKKSRIYSCSHMQFSPVCPGL